MRDEVIEAPCDMPEIGAEAGDTLIVQPGHPRHGVLVVKPRGHTAIGVVARYVSQYPHARRRRPRSVPTSKGTLRLME